MIAKHKINALQASLSHDLLNDDTPLLALVNFDGVADSVKTLHDAFPSYFSHHFAVKANPYLKILERLAHEGMGAEVASAPELELSLKAKFSNQKIIFDAPVKTQQEIERALGLNIAFNIDNFQELERIANWMNNHQSQSSIGFRINPQVGAGAVASTSTATKRSKFGIGIRDNNNREIIINACKQYSWIQCIHVHVGSVACPIELMCDGVSAAVTLAEEINQSLGHDQIRTIDIGGGLPVDFTQDQDKPTFKHYAETLKQAVPLLFTGKYKVITEFGRALLAKNAITIGRVEYTKESGGAPIALTHIGVQTLVRTVYEPEYWKRRITAFDNKGKLKEGPLIEQDIAGPACFSGDLIARKRALPLLAPNDYVMVHDTGTYHFSNHYQYNALPRIPVYGYQADTLGEVTFHTISKGQSINAVIDDYS